MKKVKHLAQEPQLPTQAVLAIQLFKFSQHDLSLNKFIPLVTGLPVAGTSTRNGTTHNIPGVILTLVLIIVQIDRT